MKLGPWILLLLFCSSCDEVDVSAIQNLNDNKIEVMGHGGSGPKSVSNSLPPNSMESIQAAIEKEGADGIEVDVQLSKDQQLIIFHGGKLQDESSCTGKVNEQNSEDILNCTYHQSALDFSDQSYRIISLEQLLTYLSRLAQKPLLTLDLKLNPGAAIEEHHYRKIFSDSLVSILTRYHYTQHTFIESTSQEMLQILQGKDPELQLFIYPGNFEDGFKVAQELNLFGITIKNDLINKEQVKKAHQENLHVTIWGVKSGSTHRDAIAKHPDHIQTDNIEGLKSLLNE